MTKVILIRPPYMENHMWLCRTQREAVQKAATLAVLHQCPYRVNSQGEYVVHYAARSLQLQAIQQEV
jgi:hypothetical protein